MAINKKLRCEIEVAFSKHAQPAWYRVVKYTVLIIAFYFFRGKKGILDYPADWVYFWTHPAFLVSPQNTSVDENPWLVEL